MLTSSPEFQPEAHKLVSPAVFMSEVNVATTSPERQLETHEVVEEATSQASLISEVYKMASQDKFLYQVEEMASQAKCMSEVDKIDDVTFNATFQSKTNVMTNQVILTPESVDTTNQVFLMPETDVKTNQVLLTPETIVTNIQFLLTPEADVTNNQVLIMFYEDVVQPSCSTEDVDPPSCSAEDIALHPCSVEDIAPPPCSTEDVTLPSCSAEDAAQSSASAEDNLPKGPGPPREGSVFCFYLLAVTSQAVGGTTETLCITVNPYKEVSLEVNLELNGDRVVLLKEISIKQEYYRCIPFQVPVVSVESVASIDIQINGESTFLNKTTKILIKPPTSLIIIQTDKPIYKPGQTVMFRIISLDSNFLTYNQTFPTIEVQDPNSNRIGQWLNVPSYGSFVDLSYPLNSEATQGFYVITVWSQKNEENTQSFEVMDYVLPTFEVTVQLPPVITILDTQATLKVCAKYTYGKPVNGTVKAKVCHNSYRYFWFTLESTTLPDICKDYIFKVNQLTLKPTEYTDRTGCGEIVLNLNEYALTDSRYQGVINVQCDVEEYGTGVTLPASASSFISSNIVTISFENSPTVFKLGMTYEGEVKVTGPNDSPMINKVVFLTAEYEMTKRPVLYVANQLTPYYPTAYLYLQPFYSKSLSFIKLRSSSMPFSCDKNTVIEAEYMIRDETRVRSYMSFFYMVMSRGHLVQQGRLLVAIPSGRVEIRGTLFLSLRNTLQLSPVAQVVLYTILSSGEAVADSMNFPIQLCLANKVSLNFSESSELPGAKVSLILRATPGSLCSVRAIDQSLLLLRPEEELNTDSVFNMLPVKTLSGYPYNIDDEDSSQCSGNPPITNIFARLRPIYIPTYGKIDVYNTFKDVGIKILTNAIVKKPSECLPFMRNEVAMAASALFARDVSADSSSSTGSVAPVVTIRKYFPETWIWDLVSVSQTGATVVIKTVPDSITTWQAGAFCTSPVGFGVAPKTQLTAFQPFFVSLTMPSSVIRGEVFTLKATVFNYLQSCMMVNVSLAGSNQFSAQVCKDCSYTSCLCADESQTFSWTITPLVLGEVSINVTAEAVQSSTLCGESAVTVPQKGRIDMVIKTLQVKAEGTKLCKSYNELLCPDGIVQTNVSLILPAVFVEGSAMASVSVLGDLMGRALQNLASLLAMPGGCGEQTMLVFAPNIFILLYLESTDQLTPQIRSTALTYLVSGYQRELTYKHTDGSYSAFGMSDPSGNTWLTAFVMKSFGSAKRYIFVGQVFVDQAKSWLGQQQQANGCFASVGQLFHTDMKGGVNDEVTLSAYVAAAMLELNYTIADPVVNRSLECLRNAYTQVNATYAKALLFYTFTLAGDQAMRNTLISDLDAKAIVSGGGRYWSRVDSGSVTDSLEVEITSYVLLALMSGPQLSGFGLGYSTSIVRWLSQQQNAYGGFRSTQDTVVALQALAKYSIITYSPAGAVNVTITSPSGVINTFNINQSNRLLYQESQLQEVPGDYNITAQGKGCVYVQFTLCYNVPPPPDQSAFTISVLAFGKCKVPILSLEVIISVRYNGQRLETNMVIINVKLLSGFSADKTSSTDGSVKRVDQADGEVIIYLNGLKKGVEKVYTLRIVQDIAVAKLKPAVVKVYDYYETGDSAVTDYTSPCT
ncbi:alpha-2-macroglobulin-like protein 1 [Ictalurus punctatus]|uniref:Alpha-2-macroglobulin-like protein 1 n=1 Tax=Ictalurus punctatus TaxID=7998 RepID=A0A9F7RHC6_ICTPU|nr:alpha-2-macroglobulin-like protein 1 [Ictalurus punctatus]